MKPHQLATEPPAVETQDAFLRNLALKTHSEARQRTDLRRDLAQSLKPSEGPFELGKSVWYWSRDQSKIRGGEWKPSRVTKVEDGPMVSIDTDGISWRVNQTKVRKNPDPWHDVVIPGLEGRDAVPTVPGMLPRPDDDEDTERPAPATPIYEPESPRDSPRNVFPKGALENSKPIKMNIDAYVR